VVSGATFDSTSQVIAGGDIDVSLTLTIISGGCSIGDQSNPKTISGMQDGSTQSRTWTITQGTSGNCVFSVSALATGSGGVASTTDSVSNTATCSNCTAGKSNVPGGGGTGSGSGGGGGGGAGSSTKIYNLGELTSSQAVEIANGDKTKFNISNVEHTLTLINYTQTTATITVESEKQTLTLTLEEEKQVDLNTDGIAEISLKLKSINMITGKVELIISPLAAGLPTGEAVKEQGKGVSGKASLLIIIILVFVAIAAIVYYFIARNRRRIGWGESL